MPNQSFDYDLFVAFAAADHAWVEGYLLDALSAVGVRCLKLADAPPGVPYLLSFEQAIQQSRYTLLVLTPSYVEFGNQLIELMAQTHGAETRSWPLVPLLLHEVELPVRLRMLTMLDARTTDSGPRVITRLCQLAQALPPAGALKRPCPYPGMVPFQESDSAQFFGRAAEIADCLHRLRLHPFLAIIGCSGSGKSSLLAAGLLPALRSRSTAGTGDPALRVMRPGSTPMTALPCASFLPAARGPGTSCALSVRPLAQSSDTHLNDPGRST